MRPHYTYRHNISNTFCGVSSVIFHSEGPAFSDTFQCSGTVHLIHKQSTMLVDRISIYIYKLIINIPSVGLTHVTPNYKIFTELDKCATPLLPIVLPGYTFV